VKAFMSCPVATSHTKTDLSPPTEAMRLLSLVLRESGVHREVQDFVVVHAAEPADELLFGRVPELLSRGYDDCLVLSAGDAVAVVRCVRSAYG